MLYMYCQQMLLLPGKTSKTILNWGGGISEKWRKTVKVAHTTQRCCGFKNLRCKDRLMLYRTFSRMFNLRQWSVNNRL